MSVRRNASTSRSLTVANPDGDLALGPNGLGNDVHSVTLSRQDDEGSESEPLRAGELDRPPQGAARISIASVSLASSVRITWILVVSVSSVPFTWSRDSESV